MRKDGQTRFDDDGNLVIIEENEQPQDDTTSEPDPIEPGDGTGFILEVKEGAHEANQTLHHVVEDHGHELEFDSREVAEEYAKQVSRDDGDLRVQAASDTEPRNIDAYLLAAHNPSIKEPAEVDGDTWTFDVGPNLYGTLGESIITAVPKAHPLVHFVRQDLDVDEESLEYGLRVKVETDCALHTEEVDGKRVSWYPDCKIVVSDGWKDETIETYCCEIKTGDASFQRSQAAAMKAIAKNERVLKIRVVIEDLPDQYTVRIDEVTT